MRSLYPRLAWDGIRKNKKLYLPYLLTCVGMVFMYYILVSLSVSPIVGEIPGATTTQVMLDLGRYVVAIFACVFLFYTHSFLTRRRQKEFGLYNILGMSKANIARLLLWETLLTAAVALLGGVTAGIVLYKLAELALVRILGGAVVYDLTIAWQVLPGTLGYFGLIFLALHIFTLLRVRLNDPLALLQSETAGEKPPKANWLLALVGLVLLGTAYYISLSIQDPMAAYTWFFVAVILVILATYLLFIAGSVTLCRLLQRNKAYYYKAEHFVSVSSMAYRMKRNGAGLASICVLATMVLVMLSSSGALVAGEEDMLMTRYPQEINVMFGVEEGITDQVDEVLPLLLDDIEPEDLTEYHCITTAGSLRDGTLSPSGSITDANWYSIYVIDLDTYNRLTGQNETLKDSELLLLSSGDPLPLTSLTIPQVGTFPIRGQAPSLEQMRRGMTLMDALTLVVPDLAAFTPLFPPMDGEQKLPDSNYAVYCSFNLPGGEAEEIAYYESHRTTFFDALENLAPGGYSVSFESRAAEKQAFYGLFGGLFFLGLLLSSVFLCATVLIIYYKQISEGYEDAARFGIMQKVGMTREEIRRSVNDQMRTVFFLPLALAAAHIAFAFPILEKMLHSFMLDNTSVFLGATVVCFLVFALFYWVVYRITSHAYFKLVSQQS